MTRSRTILGLAIGLMGCLPEVLPAQVLFANVTEQAGILPYQMAAGMTGGLAAADYDGDGDVDVFLPTENGHPNQLYENLGAGVFQEIAASVGLASQLRSRGAVWFDYDADSRLDLVVTGDCFDTPCVPGVSLLRLYRQTESGTFSEVTTSAGLADSNVSTKHRGGTVVADLDNNGYPDLVVGMWVGQPRVFLNHGGVFVDSTDDCGLGDSPDVGHWQPVAHDFTGDGWMDIFWAIDFFDNRLWVNQGPVGAGVPTFVDLAVAAGVDNAWNEMGVSVGDYDNDGDGDVYITNIYNQWGGTQRHNTLYRNDSVGGAVTVFAEIAKSVGVSNGGWGWGTTFFDADNDGWLDLAETNGTFLPDPVYEVPMRLFMNDGGGAYAAFADVAATAGLGDDRWGSGLVAFDYDRDGDLDLMQTVAEGAAVLYQNQGSATTGRSYLVVRPRSSGPNTHAIGARVTVRVGALTQTRWITAGTSMGSQEPAEAFFGLGDAAEADEVAIDWPHGYRSVLTQVAANQVVEVTSGPIFADGFEGGDLSKWFQP